MNTVRVCSICNQNVDGINNFHICNKCHGVYCYDCGGNYQERWCADCSEYNTRKRFKNHMMV